MEQDEQREICRRWHQGWQLVIKKNEIAKWLLLFISSVVSDSLWLMNCRMPGFSVHRYLPKFVQTHVHWVSAAIQPSHLLSSTSLALNFSQHQVFSSVSALRIRWPKYLSFSFSISPSNEYSWLISLGWIGWISLQSKELSRVFSNTTVQKHQFFGSQLFFTVQLSHPYMTTGKTIALTRWNFVGKVMSLLFNMLSRFVTGEGNGNPLQCSCLENPRDGGAWWATVYGVTQSRTQLK